LGGRALCGSSGPFMVVEGVTHPPSGNLFYFGKVAKRSNSFSTPLGNI